MQRVRFIQFNVQPVAVVDDGDNLTPIEIKPVSIPAHEWELFAAGGFTQWLNAIRAEVDKTNPAANGD